MGAHLRVDSVGVDIDQRRVLEDVNLEVASGQSWGIAGPSGSGKSTLARVLAGILIPNRGQVRIDDIAMEDCDVWERPAFVAQDFGLIACLTAAETVSLPLQIRGVHPVDVRQRASHWLGAFGLETCAHRPVNELSGGQRQRVAIARALGVESTSVILDEPTSELDLVNRDLVLSILIDAHRAGTTLVIVSHDDDVLAQMEGVHHL
jgi:ABC-type lipoprotein export system ATPase subunit